MSDDDEIDLNALSDEDLTAQMHDDLYDGLGEEIEEGTNILLSRGWDANRVLNDALVEGMRIVGIDFRDGILFVPEVLLAANAMKAGMAILRPLLAETGAEPIGKIVIGTVKGNVLIYNKQSRKKVPVLGKHPRKITCGAWSKDNRLALGSEDSTLTLSNSAGDTLEQTELKHPPKEMCFAIQKTNELMQNLHELHEKIRDLEAAP